MEANTCMTDLSSETCNSNFQPNGRFHFCEFISVLPVKLKSSANKEVLNPHGREIK